MAGPCCWRVPTEVYGIWDLEIMKSKFFIEKIWVLTDLMGGAFLMFGMVDVLSAKEFYLVLGVGQVKEVDAKWGERS